MEGYFVSAGSSPAGNTQRRTPQDEKWEDCRYRLLSNIRRQVIMLSCLSLEMNIPAALSGIAHSDDAVGCCATNAVQLWLDSGVASACERACFQ